MVWLLTKHHLSAAIRDKLFIGLLVLIVVGMSLSTFLGSSSITESDQFSLVFASGGLRIGGLLTLVLFTVFYIRRCFDSHAVEYLLSKPITRFQFLLSYTVSLSFLALIIAAFMVVALVAMPGTVEPMNIIFWGASIFAELIIMVNVALFFSLMLSSAVSASMISIAFYVLARLIGGILAIVNSGASPSHIIFEKSMLLISIFIPRLDLMGQSSWLVYGIESADISWAFILMQGMIFCGLVFAASFWDLQRKQF